MHARLPAPPRRLTDLEREVLLNAAARDAVGVEVEPPFRLRAGLLVEMLGLYDDLRRRDSSVDDFERVLVRELQRDADDDRGAARLLRQTHVSRGRLPRIRGAKGRDRRGRRVRAAGEAARGGAGAAASPDRRDGRRAIGRRGRTLAGGSCAA